MKNKEEKSPKEILHLIGSKATSSRLLLLSLLKKSEKPLSINRIKEELRKVSKDIPDEATLYRMLETFVLAGIVAQIDFEHGHAHYEFILGKKHHHHLVCKKCSTIEDVTFCASEQMNTSVLKKSKGFVSIQHHALEFFGTCIKCSV